MAGAFNLRGVGAIYLDPNPSLPEGGDLNSGILTFNGTSGALYLSYFNQSQIQVTQQIPGGETGILASNILVGKSGTFGEVSTLVGALYLPSGDLSSSSAYLQVSNLQGVSVNTFTVEILPVGGQIPVATFAISADPSQMNAGVVSVTNPLPLTEGWYGVFASAVSSAPCLIGGLRLWIYPTP
jgi:hypothetical protein